MKCPKCKYTTFDYMDTCPRCGKDISGEKVKLNIISIKPNTPFLLGSLTGDLDDSSAAFVVPESVKEASESMAIDANEIYDDGSELNINIEEEPVVESESEAVDIGDLGAADADYELEIDLDSEEMPEEVIEQGGAQELGSEQDEGEAQPEAQESEEKGEGEVLEMELEDMDLKLESTEEEDSEK
jgi:hypothetical protein